MSTNNSFPMNWDDQEDNALFDSLFSSGLNEPYFKNKKLNKSFDESSNENTMKSPFGEKSLFYTPKDGSFVDYAIDRKHLLENLIKCSNSKSTLKYNLIHYHLEKNTEFIIDDEILNIKTEINTLEGEIDFSKKPKFSFSFNINNQKVEFKIYYEFTKFTNSADYNRYAIILTFNKYVDLELFFNKTNKELQKNSEDNIKLEFNKAFTKAKGQSEILDFLYETAPNFVLIEREDVDLYNDLELLSSKRIDNLGTNENISILNLINGFKDKKWFYDKVNNDPVIVRKLFKNFSPNFIDKLIIAVSKIGNSIWIKKDKENAWNYELYYPEFETNYTDKTNVNDPYVASTGFAYYNDGLKMYKIGTAIFAYDSRVTLGPSSSREIGPDDMQYAYIPMKLQISKSTIYIPVFVAEYFTNKKIDDEWWTMLNNLVIGLLPEASASIRTVSTIAKLFSGKKIQTVEELIEFLDKIDDTVKATELEQYGIEALFRGTTRNAKGELFSGNANSIAHGASTSTDPIRAVIFGIESATESKQQGFLQVFVPKNLEGLNLQASNAYRFDLELEVIVKTSPENLSKFAVVEIPIEDARQIVNKLYNTNIPKSIYISDFENGKHYLDNTQKLTPKQSLAFYKQVIKLEK